MSNERKTGWATITYKDGSSVTGEILAWYGDTFDLKVFGSERPFPSQDVTITYIDPPMPALPDGSGAVIEAENGVRFFKFSSPSQFLWISSISIGGDFTHTEKTVLEYCHKHGGFTVLLEVKIP